MLFSYGRVRTWIFYYTWSECPWKIITCTQQNYLQVCLCLEASKSLWACSIEICVIHIYHLFPQGFVPHYDVRKPRWILYLWKILCLTCLSLYLWWILLFQETAFSYDVRHNDVQVDVSWWQAIMRSIPGISCREVEKRHMLSLRHLTSVDFTSLRNPYPIFTYRPRLSSSWITSNSPSETGLTLSSGGPKMLPHLVSLRKISPRSPENAFTWNYEKVEVYISLTYSFS